MKVERAVALVLAWGFAAYIADPAQPWITALAFAPVLIILLVVMSRD